MLADSDLQWRNQTWRRIRLTGWIRPGRVVWSGARRLWWRKLFTEGLANGFHQRAGSPPRRTTL